ncbi:amino acid permease [Thermohalobacter berrensis]|uniref:Amino acid permease n=1 Tax=Thermohalobacter berrensis TaxID=99594 RepID=A0A419SWF6_9FIRM|nr:amino acid permease [Thermohalobacter berrensis]RKD29531.1 amino acid permease [Thermohalobacter berrensis]
MRYETSLKEIIRYIKNKKEEKKKMKGITWWQLSLIGIGSIIGAAFFLGTGLSISLTGPAVILSYFLAGLVAFFTFGALAEMSVNDPEPGSFREYSKKAFGHCMGFVSGWIYWTAGILIMSSIITALSIFTKYWFPDIPLYLFAIIYSLMGFGINLLGVKDFGQIESIFAIIKISILIIFIFFGIIILLGFTSYNHRISGNFFIMRKYNWFPNGFKGIWSSMIFSLFSYAGVGLVGIASNELDNKKNILKSVYFLVAILIIIYVLSIFIALNMVSWENINESESFFVTALSNYSIPYIDSIFNFIIIIATFPTLVGTIYACSNILFSLADNDDAPKIFVKRNKRGVPIYALYSSGIGLVIVIVLSYLLPKTIYEYMTTAAGVLLLLNWIIILSAEIKYRKYYYKKDGKISFKMIGTPYTSYGSILFIVFSLIGSAFRKIQRVGLLIGISIVLVIFSIYFMMFTLNKSNREK